MALFDVVSIIMVKETKLIGFLVFESLVTGGGYCMKFFFLYEGQNLNSCDGKRCGKEFRECQTIMNMLLSVFYALVGN